MNPHTYTSNIPALHTHTQHITTTHQHTNFKRKGRMNEPRKERFLLGRAAQIVMVDHKTEGPLPALAFLP